MNRTYFLLWFALISIILLPTAAGRFLLDLAGGVIIALLALPLLLTGVGWLGWRFLQSRIIQCDVCGTTLMTGAQQCPACGANLLNQKEKKDAKSTVDNSIPASSVTIDISAQDCDS